MARGLASEVCIASGAGEGAWHAAEVEEKVVVCCDEHMVVSELVGCKGGCVCVEARVAEADG